MHKVLDKIEKAFEFVLAIMTGIMVVLAIYQFMARYFFGWGITWTEETMRYLFVAAIMLGIYFVSGNAGFATITMFSDWVAKKSQTGHFVLRVFQNIVQIIFYLILFYYGMKLLQMVGGRVSTATHTPFTLIYAPIPIGAFMGCVNSIIKCIREFTPKVSGKGANTEC
jgi:TRAP-type C4-dicarboxylate transport system permease small subunit